MKRATMPRSAFFPSGTTTAGRSRCLTPASTSCSRRTCPTHRLAVPDDVDVLPQGGLVFRFLRPSARPAAPQRAAELTGSAETSSPSCGCSTRAGGGGISRRTALRSSPTSRWGCSTPPKSFQNLITLFVSAAISMLMCEAAFRWWNVLGSSCHLFRLVRSRD